jgi:hypothetical protein
MPIRLSASPFRCAPVPLPTAMPCRALPAGSVTQLLPFGEDGGRSGAISARGQLHALGNGP